MVIPNWETGWPQHVDVADGAVCDMADDASCDLVDGMVCDVIDDVVVTRWMTGKWQDIQKMHGQLVHNKNNKIRVTMVSSRSIEQVLEYYEKVKSNSC